jgi:molybdopterin-guanine dinucleotide biosynthesis protein A
MTRKSAIILLAGGQARRMGGGDKNLIELAGKPVLRHVLDRVDFANRPIMLNANGYAGPLAGILTGLEWVAANQADCTHMVSLATDAPFLPIDLIARLESALDDGADIAQAMSYTRRHPVFAIWPVALAGALRKAVIDDGLRKIDDFTARYHCVTVEFAGTPDPFMNLNRPDDFDLAIEFLAKPSQDG